MTAARQQMLCIFSRILGGKTFSQQLDLFLLKTVDADLVHVDYEEKDFLEFPSSFRLIPSDSLDASNRIKRKMRRLGINPLRYDVLFFQSFHLTLPFLSAIRTKATILALDSTPVIALKGNAQAGVTLPWLRIVPSLFINLFFNKIFRHIDFFLARTDTVRQSLIRDYGIDNDRIRVTYSPMEAITSKLDRSHINKPRVLFVGNDFERKGGPFILEAFQYVSNKAELVIVSKDSSLIERSHWPTNVTFIAGLAREELLDFYQECDIFVLPTYKDELGIVICEAMSCGLPVVARNATAQHELVIDGQTGYLMNYGSNPKEWAEKLRLLIENPALRARLGEGALLMARSLFNPEKFHQHLSDALTTVGINQRTIVSDSNYTDHLGSGRG